MKHLFKIAMALVVLEFTGLRTAWSAANTQVGQPAIKQLATEGASQALQLTLPPYWYAVVGSEMSLYFDNIVLTKRPSDRKFTVTCDVPGKADETHWTLMPAAKDVGEHAITVTVADAAGRELQRATMKLRIAPKNAGEGTACRIIHVGDSLTANGAYARVVSSLLSETGVKPTMLGTHVMQGSVTTEGWGGWSWKSFLSEYVYWNQDGTKTPHQSPFVVSENGTQKLDVGRYIKETCSNTPPDVCTFLLGINDCAGSTSKKYQDVAAVDARIDSVFADAEKLLKAFHAAAPACALGVAITTPPNGRDEIAQGDIHRWEWKSAQHRLVQREIKQFANREAEGIYLIPTELSIDPIAGYPNNLYHPNGAGYNQIGDAFYSWIKWKLYNEQIQPRNPTRS